MIKVIRWEKLLGYKHWAVINIVPSWREKNVRKKLSGLPYKISEVAINILNKKLIIL